MQTRESTYHNIPVIIHGEISDEEVVIYIEQQNNKKGIKFSSLNLLSSITVIAEDEFVKISYQFKDPIPFERIRRITGYLVGSTSKWNDGKRAEEKERVKHSIN